MARSKWKLINFNKKILQKLFVESCVRRNSKVITKSRGATIPWFFKKKNVYIYKGLSWTKLCVQQLHIGHKFGEFSLTKKPFYAPSKETTTSKLHKR